MAAALKQSPFGDDAVVPAAPHAVVAPVGKVSPFGDAPAERVIADSDPMAGIALPGTTTQVQIDQKKAAADEAARPGSGLAENAVAGLKNSIITLMSAPGWAYQTAANAGAGMAAVNAGGDVDKAIPFPNADGGRSLIVGLLKKAGISDPNDTKAASLAEKLLRSFGENAGLVAGPETILPKLLTTMKEAGIVGEDAVKLTTALTGEGSSGGQVLKDATVGGGFGAASTAVAESPLPDNVKPIAELAAGLGGGVLTHAALAAPGVVLKAGGKAAQTILAPFTEGGRETLAGKHLAEAATDPVAAVKALETPQEGVEGSVPTTAQKSGDMGLLSAERKAATADPVPFQQRRADQNEARTGAIEKVQPTGAAETVISALRDHTAAIDDAANAELATAHAKGKAEVDAATQAAETDAAKATDKARADATSVGQPVAPDVAGDTMRGHYEAARAIAKTNERALWNAVDPHGTLALDAGGTKSEAARIVNEIPKTAKPPEGEERQLFAVAADLKPTESLTDMSALQARVKAAIREERLANGETPAYRRMSQLNHALQSDLETAVAAQVSHQEQAVKAGTMRVEDTIAAKLKAETESWYANRAQAQTRDVSGTGIIGDAGRGSSAVSGSRGAEVSTGRGPRNGPGAKGLPADDLSPNLDEAALGRLTAARGATKSRVEDFDNKTLSPIRRRPSTTSPYDMSVSTVPAKIFHPGPKAADDIAAYRAAVGDGEALKALEGYAVDRLHVVAMRPDGTLDPSKIATWRKNHADALGAFPELDARLRQAHASSEAMKTAREASAANVAEAETKAKADTTAAERKAKDVKSEAQSGAIGKILKADSPDEVVSHVGAIFSRADRTREMARVRAATKGNKDAQEGLRKAIVDHILKKYISNAEVGVSGVSSIKSDGFQTFVRENEAALKAAGFTDDEIHTFKMVASDLRQANRSIVAIKLPGGPGTAQDVHAATKGRVRSLLQYLAVPLLTEGGAEILHAPGWGLALGVAGGVVAGVRSLGMRKVDQLVREALLDPELAVRLMKKVAPQQVQAETNRLIEAMRPGLVAAAAGGGKAKDEPSK